MENGEINVSKKRAGLMSIAILEDASECFSVSQHYLNDSMLDTHRRALRSAVKLAV